MKAWELLSDESKWCKHVPARNAGDQFVDSNHWSAKKWCVVGAISKCYQDRHEAMRLVEAVRLEVKASSVGEWNDCPRRKFNEVQEVLKKLDI